jgi:hypothetical protein
MYIAELQGKFSRQEERMEDILTSNVFSFFKYAKREIFLNELLKLINVYVSLNELEKAEFIFWPSYEDGTQPDLVIIVGNHYLLFEAKFISGFGKGEELLSFQLIREAKMGELEAQKIDKIFHLIAVTAHYSKHKFYIENSEVSDIPITWINWHQIALLLDKILYEKEELDIETKTFATDLYHLLVKKDLRKYAGQDILGTIPLLQSPSEALFFDAKSAQYRGDFLGFQVSLEEFSPIKQFAKMIFYAENKFYFRNLSDSELSETIKNIFFRR